MADKRLWILFCILIKRFLTKYIKKQTLSRINTKRYKIIETNEEITQLNNYRGMG
ncbi:MAG: hypothetical protein RHS_4688 [Robinsoniella sp. RHS]|nr:MAG: hypothetical protein RHS_4688 [Robinsoniella sp. RHS]